MASVSELTSNLEASPQVYCTENDASGVICASHMNGSIKLSEALSDTGMSQNTSIDSVCNSQCNNFTWCNSYCSTDSDLVSQSQGLQLTNTQKVELFAKELDMIKVPVSVHSSQNSSLDSFVEASPVFM